MTRPIPNYSNPVALANREIQRHETHAFVEAMDKPLGHYSLNPCPDAFPLEHEPATIDNQLETYYHPAH